MNKKMSRITKQQPEIQLQQIFRMLLESKTQEEIAKELNVNVRTVQRYIVKIDKRYGEMQRQKTDNTLFMECALFKNRMLTLYRGLERIVTSITASGAEAAKCAEVAASIAIDVLRLEAEGIKTVKNGLVSIAAATAHKNAFKKLRSKKENDNNNNSSEQQSEQQSTNFDDRKF
jgi:translation initiation factor 2 alpha subunit (eIF-2alpha)